MDESVVGPPRDAAAGSPSNPSVDELDRLLRPAPAKPVSAVVSEFVARWRPSADGSGSTRHWTVAVLVAVLAVGGYGGYRVVRHRPAEVTLPRATAPQRSIPAPAGPDDATSGPSSPVPAAASAPGADVIVHVAGAVVHPGVVRIAGGSRWNDAIHAAGGPTVDADLDRVGLAAPATDGSRLYVPRRGESPPDPVPVAPPGPGGTDGTGPAGGSSGSAAPLDLNSATLEQLDALPGVGPSTAAAIIEFRDRSGGFRSVEDLDEVSGIGPAKLERLAPLVRV